MEFGTSYSAGMSACASTVKRVMIGFHPDLVQGGEREVVHMDCTLDV